MNDIAAPKHGALAWLWLAAGVVALDQATKWVVVRNFGLYEVATLLPVLDLTRLHNTGVSPTASRGTDDPRLPAIVLHTKLSSPRMMNDTTNSEIVWTSCTLLAI